MKTMTDAQRTLAEQNLKLVPYVIRRYYSQREDSEERMSIGYEALCKAAIAFDPAKGYTFATYAIQAIKMRLIMDHRYRTQPCRDERKVARSLDEPITCKDDGVCLGDTIPAPFDLDDIVSTRMLSERISQLPDKMQRVLAMRAAGVEQKYIAVALGISQPSVSRMLKRIRDRLLREMSDDVA